MRSRAAAIVAALAIAVVLAGDVVVLVVRQSSSVPPEPATPPPSAPAGTPAPSPLEAVLPELVAFVEENRGLRFKEPPKVELLDDAQFTDRVLEDGGPEGTDAEEEAYLGFLRALGLIEGDVDLEDVFEDQTESIVGFYDTGARALFARGSEATPYVKYVLVHELTHALDDQHFGLDRPHLEDDDGVAFQALVEGSAVVIEERWLDSRPAEEQAAILAEEEAVGLQTEAEVDVFARLLSFPYAQGPSFVAAILEEGGQRRLDDALRAPPVTTEQVLHPERFLAGEGPRTVADPPADGQTVERGTLGELGLILVLDEAMERSQVLRAAAGWGGDRYVAWTDGFRTCVRWSIVMDSAQDTTEVTAALQAWVAGSAGSTMERTSPVTVTSCG